jgi:hypothetical protein
MAMNCVICTSHLLFRGGEVKEVTWATHMAMMRENGNALFLIIIAVYFCFCVSFVML